MYISDLSTYCYIYGRPIPGVLAVGWLDKSHPFTVGPAPKRFVTRLRDIIAGEHVNQTRGFHQCNLCGRDRIKFHTWNKTKLLGSAEIWVPDADGSNIFAAPTMIQHYIIDHNYLPPAQFIEAVQRFSEHLKWDGQSKFNDLTRRAILEVDG